MAGALVTRDCASSRADHDGTTEDLAVVNEIVARALSSWQVADRVMRLAMPSLHYTAADLDHMSFVIARNTDYIPVAVAVWEVLSDSASRAPTTELLLHGLYVVPESQRCGFGACLLQHVEHVAAERGVRVITVHAWRDAESFFRARGFESDSEIPLYPRRLRKRLLD